MRGTATHTPPQWVAQGRPRTWLLRRRWWGFVPGHCTQVGGHCSTDWPLLLAPPAAGAQEGHTQDPVGRTLQGVVRGTQLQGVARGMWPVLGVVPWRTRRAAVAARCTHPGEGVHERTGRLGAGAAATVAVVAAADVLVGEALRRTGTRAAGHGKQPARQQQQHDHHHHHHHHQQQQQQGLEWSPALLRPNPPQAAPCRRQRPCCS